MFVFCGKFSSFFENGKLGDNGRLGRAYQHRDLFPMMVKNWRDEWKQGDFSFYWVQLTNFMGTKDNPDNSAWAEFRESQSMSRSLPNSGEAVIIDIGEAKDIHPRNKQDVGYRLALLALAKDYGENIPPESPRFASAAFEDNKATLKFDFVYDGLRSCGALPTGFSIAGEDNVFHWAQAEIVGKDSVVVTSTKVAKPIAVRYGWADNLVVTMFNSASLPMVPFRTDDWPGVTINNNGQTSFLKINRNRCLGGGDFCRIRTDWPAKSITKHESRKI